MRDESPRILSRRASWILSLAATAYLLTSLGVRGEALLSSWPGLLLLALPAALAASLASRRPTAALPRLALAFVIAGLILLPAPGGLFVGLVASAFGHGAGVLGLRNRSIAAFAVSATVIALVQIAAPFALPLFPDSPAGLLVFSLLLYFLLRFLAVGLTLAGNWRSVALESAVVPLAWLLVDTLGRGAWLQALIIGALAVAVEVALSRLARTLEALSRSDEDLTSRLSELDTLHAIGREILSSLELHRVFAVVERECRKIFPLDYCFLALADREGSRMQAVYRRRRGESSQTIDMPLEEGLAVHVAAAKRGMRIDDFEQVPADSPIQSGLVDGASRSALAVPLIVEDQVVGVLSIQSRQPAAYDDHQLAVLTIIAQQSAVAIENARRYERATVDSLTGFLLRDQFFKRLDEEQLRVDRYGGDFSLIMLDLDSFKGINDQHGHMAGDQYLRQVSDAIRSELRAADVACRYGGDEFCLLLPETDGEGSATIAERIRGAVANTIVGMEGAALRTTASIGVTIYPRHEAADIAALLRHADEALYRAKRAGRDCVVSWAA